MIRLGIIGYSEGNGHPFSWSAICNGWNQEHFAECPFPVIREYLSRRDAAKDTLGTALVTHIWTQDEALSKSISSFANIPHVVPELNDLVGAVDGILLARDDAERHFEFAIPFLEAGIPIYVDKPICLTMGELKAFEQAQRYQGQLFTCSALRYARELQMSGEQRSSLGEIRNIEGFTPNSWSRYAIHVIEPILNLVAPDDQIVGHTKSPSAVESLEVRWRSGVTTRFTATGEVKSAIELLVQGTKGEIRLSFRDSYECFREALSEFVRSATTRSPVYDPEIIRRAVTILELGL